MTEPYDFTTRQQAIVDFVKKNPDSCIKERIVESVIAQGIGSRVTILKDIKNLEELEVIYIDKEKQNSQIHHVRINSNSVFISVLEDLGNIKKAFFSLAEATKYAFNGYYRQILEIYKEVESKGSKIDMNEEYNEADQVEGIWETISLAKRSLESLFQHFIGIYLLHSIFEWPKKVEDKKALDKLYTALFETIKEIHIELSNCYHFAEDKTHMIGEIVNQLFFLKRDKLCNAIVDLECVGVGEYAEDVLDLLWKSGFQYTADGLEQAYKYEESSPRRREIEKNIDKLRDWRDVVNKYVNSLPDPIMKAFIRSGSNKGYIQNT
jgi:hypothetical protein